MENNLALGVAKQSVWQVVIELGMARNVRSGQVVNEERTVRPRMVNKMQKQPVPGKSVIMFLKRSVVIA
jgi:hypothetical protein